jgi:hypothetical protein
MTKDMSKFTLDEFRELLLIDKHHLDDAIEQQAAIYGHVADRVAQEESRRDEAKSSLEAADAELSANIREGHTRKKAGKDRLTEGAIKEMIILDPFHIKAVKSLNAAQRSYQQWEALKWAFNQRGQMLRDLAHLYSSEYFTQTSVRGSEADVRDGAARTAREIMRQRREGKR